MTRATIAEQILPSTSSAFVASLFNTLSAISSQQTSDSNLRSDVERTSVRANRTRTRASLAAVAERHGADREQKEKRELPREACNIFLTLHVLFPHVLLDALDLLDRRCVIRLVVTDEDNESGINTFDPAVVGAENNGVHRQIETTVNETPRTHGNKVDTSSTAEASAARNSNTPQQTLHHTTHHVFSARLQVPTSVSGLSKSRYTQEERFTTQSTIDSLQANHHVHLHAWNCTCPMFAFAAFSNMQPALASRPDASNPRFCFNPSPLRVDFKTIKAGYKTPPFGKLSLSYAAESTEGYGGRLERQRNEPQREFVPPVCKHLLACLLGELCPEFFGPFCHSDRQRVGHNTTGLGDERVLEDHNGRGGIREMVVGLVEASGMATSAVGN